MTDGDRGGALGAAFDQGLLSETIEAYTSAVEAWFNDIHTQKYVDGYRRLALSGTTGALDALGKQQSGNTTKSTDPVDVTNFFADAWLSTVSTAMSVTRDLNRQFVNDLSTYLGTPVPTPPKRAAPKKGAKKAAQKRARKPARKPAKKTG